jgi:hypothetical protein
MLFEILNFVNSDKFCNKNELKYFNRKRVLKAGIPGDAFASLLAASFN